jgi:hypothetical protein
MNPESLIGWTGNYSGVQGINNVFYIVNKLENLLENT